MTGCLICDGWGCAHCALEREEARGGEQGLTATELELSQLKAERDALCGLIDDLSESVELALNVACGIAWDSAVLSMHAICIGCEAMTRREDMRAHAATCEMHPVGELRLALEKLLDEAERHRAGAPLPAETWFIRRDFARAVLEGGAT